MSSEFLSEKLEEIEARIAELHAELERVDGLRAELAALERARAVLRGERAPAPAARNGGASGRAGGAAGLPGRRRAAKPLAPEAEAVAGTVLTILVEAPGLTVDELATRTGLAPGSVHRLLGVLVRGGRVAERDGRFSAA